jgi:drug/metabolite transporter (DMT)-like permease
MKHLIRARLFMLVAAAIWGTSFVVGRVGVSYINPFAFAFLENCIGLCILVLGLRLQERKVPASQGSNILMIPESVLLGLLNGLAYTLQYVGLSLTTAINTSLLVNVSMPFVPLIAWALLKERPSLRRIGGLLIGIGGAILVTTKGEVALLIGGELLGNLSAIGAGASWAFWIVFTQRGLEKTRSPLRLAVGNATYTVVTLFLVVLVTGAYNIGQVSNLEPWLAIIYLGIMSIGIGYLLYYEGLREIGGSASAAYILLQSVVALALGVILLAEPLTPPVMAGAVMILLAVIIAG